MTRDVNDSGIPIRPVYDAIEGQQHELGEPGSFPYGRGIRKDMYRGRLWTMRQYAGFGTAAESNARYRYLLEHGQTGLSVAFDLPTQLGFDSDAPQARGEVGKVGVAIDSVADMETLLEGVPLERVTVSMTINAPASVLLALLLAVARRRGIPFSKLGGTVQNDVLKEYVARGTYIYPPKPSIRLVTDVMAYCAREVPNWNAISISGYHIREAGSTAVEELAFTLSNGKAYLRAAQEAGIVLDEIAPRISFFWNAHNDFFEEIAKFRAARYLWAHIARDEFECRDPRSQMLRFHTQTGGSTLTAQEPENNVVRVALQALAAVLGGTQSLHTNGKDEALALPTAQSALVALRTQQIIAYESGVVDVVDPMAGSYYLETLTDRVDRPGAPPHRRDRCDGREHRCDRERLDAGADCRIGLSRAASGGTRRACRRRCQPICRERKRPRDRAAASRRARRARAGRAARGLSSGAGFRSGGAPPRTAARRRRKRREPDAVLRRRG